MYYNCNKKLDFKITLKTLFKMQINNEERKEQWINSNNMMDE